MQFYETKPAFIYSLDLVIQIVKEKYSILNILKPSVCDVLSSISSNAKPIQYLPNRFKVLAWKVKSQAFCCMCIYNIYTKFYPVTSSLLHYQRWWHPVDNWNIIWLNRQIDDIDKLYALHQWQFCVNVRNFAIENVMFEFSQITKKKGHCTLVYKCLVSENFCFSFCVLLSPSSLRKQ